MSCTMSLRTTESAGRSSACTRRKVNLNCASSATLHLHRRSGRRQGAEVFHRESGSGACDVVSVDHVEQIHGFVLRDLLENPCTRQEFDRQLSAYRDVRIGGPARRRTLGPKGTEHLGG